MKKGNKNRRTGDNGLPILAMVETYEQMFQTGSMHECRPGKKFWIFKRRWPYAQ